MPAVEAVATMGISIPVVRVSQVKCERLTTLVEIGCSLVSYRFVYQDPPNQMHKWWENAFSGTIHVAAVKLT